MAAANGVATLGRELGDMLSHDVRKGGLCFWLAVVANLLSACAPWEPPTIRGIILGAYDDNTIIIEVVGKEGRELGATSPDSTGAFELPLTVNAIQSPAIVIRGQGGSDDIVMPAILDASIVNRRVFVIMLTREWTIENGRYAGVTVPISEVALTAKDETTWLADPPVSWVADVEPIPVRLLGDVRMETNDGDLTLLATAIEELEEALGEDLLDIPKAVDQDEIQGNRDLHHRACDVESMDELPKGILVCIETFATSFPYWRQLDEIVVGWTAYDEECVDERGSRGRCIVMERTRALISLDRVSLSSHEVAMFAVVHELMHALGFGHTCYFSSIMHGGFSEEMLVSCNSRGLSPRFEIGRALKLTAFDVAHAQLVLAMVDEIRTRASTSEVYVSRPGGRAVASAAPRAAPVP